MTHNKAICWSSFDFTLSPEAKHVFEEATVGLLGVKYTPFAFATQVVAGIGYAFLCEGVAPTRSPNSSVVKIRIYQPLANPATAVEDRPMIESIEAIVP